MVLLCGLCSPWPLVCEMAVTPGSYSAREQEDIIRIHKSSQIFTKPQEKN